MEVLSLLATRDWNTFGQRLVLNKLSTFNKGQLVLELPNGTLKTFGDGIGHHADLKIHCVSFFKKMILGGDIGFAEAYMDGDWSTSDLTKLIRWTIANIEANGLMSGSNSSAGVMNLLSSLNRFVHLKNKNTKSGSSKNIQYHYDLSNDFYKLFLDQTMSYSCAVFEEGINSLQEAQTNKYRRICEQLEIQKGDHILEIGCGWGGFIDFACQNYDCKITATTISHEQYDYAFKLIQEKGYQDRVTLLKSDYRDLEGEYDKVVSIEMIEAVGHEFLSGYFKAIEKFLKPSGVAVIQAITALDSRYETYRKGVDFIQKYIFPGGHLPSVRAMTNACEGTELNLYSVKDIGLSYAKTLKYWYLNFLNKLENVKSLGFDDRFLKMWEYYLCYCEAAFLERNISTVHVTFIKPNNTTYKII